MTCLHNHDQILEFLRKIFLKDFQIYQNYLCALRKRKGHTSSLASDLASSSLVACACTLQLSTGLAVVGAVVGAVVTTGAEGVGSGLTGAALG